MGGLFDPVNPWTAERVARLCELAWWDGLRTGLLAGVLMGIFVGIVVARLLREERSNGS